MKVTSFNNKSITSNTATADILDRYANINNVTIEYKNIRRRGIYIWDLHINDLAWFTAGIASTRRHCLDDTLLQHAMEITK